jgi:hypothetical protein
MSLHTQKSTYKADTIIISSKVNCFQYDFFVMKICSLSINQQSLNKLISKISIIQYIMKLHDNKTDIGSITQTAIFFSTSIYNYFLIFRKCCEIKSILVTPVYHESHIATTASINSTYILHK